MLLVQSSKISTRTGELGNNRTSGDHPNYCIIEIARPEYWEESWRFEENCLHLNSSEKPFANAGLKKYQKKTNDDNNNNNNNNNKGMWHGYVKLDNKLSPDLQDIRRRYKLYRENHENSESRIGSRRKKLQRGIFQRDAISPLLFVITIMPINHILTKCCCAYKLCKSPEKIYYQMHIDDIKPFAKTEEFDSLI